MRYVVDTGMVAHLWANQTQDNARNRGNHSFRERYLFSYAAIIGILHTRKGVTAALMTTRRWSSTTNKHQMLMRRSLKPDQLRFNVLLMEKEGNWHQRNIKDYKDRIRELVFKAFRARSNKTYLLRQHLGLISELRAYAEFFGLKDPVRDGEFDLEGIKVEIQKEAKRADRRQAAERRRQAKEAAERRAEYEENLKKWRAGKNVELNSYSQRQLYHRGDRPSVPVALRIKGSRIQTSLGAIVEIDEAKTLLPLVRAGVEWKTASLAAGGDGKIVMLAGFMLDKVEADGTVYIGCHTILRSEIERIAAILGV